MKQAWWVLILSAIAISIVVIAAVSWHSVEEIHYLKTFYPKQFTVEEAFYASGVEFNQSHTHWFAVVFGDWCRDLLVTLFQKGC